MYPSDIRPLTSLRFAAALWVLVYHFRSHLGLALERFRPVAKGYLGVDLFFILSGFILAHVYLAAWREKRFSYRSFLWARLARIYPVHLATLALMIVLWVVATRLGISFEALAFDPAVLPQHVFLLQAWGTTPTDQWNFPSWSISAEWFAYLGFPIVALAVLALRRRPTLAIGAAVAVFVLLFASAAAIGVLFTDMTSHIGALRIIPSFLFGAAIYQFGAQVRVPRSWSRMLLLLALVWIAFMTLIKASDLAIWPALGLLIFALGETAKPANQTVLGTPWLVYLGEASFALYMIHLPVDILYFHGLDKIAPNVAATAPWLAWLGVFPACVLAAIAVHEAIEKPARNWLRAHDPFAKKPPPEPHDEPVI